MKKRYVVSELVDETPEVLLIRFKPEDGKAINFDPGMFFMISGIDAVTGKPQVARAFSIASDPVSTEMEYYIVKEHGGHKTHFLSSKPGEPYMINGPFGQFKFVPSVDKKVVFIAGGTGLAPFMSMLRYIERTKAGTDVVLLYSVKYPTEIIRKQELFRFSDSLKSRIIVTVTRAKPEDAWTGECRRIDAEMIKKYAADYIERVFYICGPLPFVNSMKDAIKSLGVKGENVKADVWG
jgi:ferredoxin-NADP reductase